MKKLCERTEELISDIVFCGYENVSADIIKKLCDISENMKELGMREGSRLVSEISDEIAACRRNENDGARISGLISRMEFYITSVIS